MTALKLNRALGGGNPPFSFTCGGRPSGELLNGWELKRGLRKLDDRPRTH